MKTDTLIRVRSLRMEFAGNAVLRDIDAQIHEGEILGVIGENGAGKSTFMKILSGIYEPVSGTIEIGSKKVSFKSPADARLSGISIVPQEFNLAESLSVEENIFLGAEILGASGLLLDKAAMRGRTVELLKELGANVSPADRIDLLSAAQKQFIEICKALAFKAKILILDEPTTMLTKREIDMLFTLMRSLKERGMTLIYVSHKLQEVKEICDRVIILKDGELVHESLIKDIEPAEMARMMVGRELREIYPPVKPSPGRTLLDVRGLTSPGVFSDVSFSVREGEILGFAGLVGAGRTETAEALMGLRPSSGEVLLDGKDAKARSAGQAVGFGLSYLSEDRQGSGILTDFGIAENMTLVSLASYCNSASIIDGGKEMDSANSWKKRFGIKAPDLKARLETLSGGNQQKVSLVKALDPGPRVIIADEPTRGVDVAAKQEIYRFLSGLAAGGASILLISSELEEILGMCRRVIVMKEGRIAGELEGDAVTERGIMYLATGIREGEAV